MKKTSGNKYWQFIKKNGLSILMGLAIVILLINPNAKSWVLRQSMRSGLFNASIDAKETGIPQQPAIDFDFKSSNGPIQNTESLRGKVVFINFWASWCPPCRAEFPAIQALYSQFKDDPRIFFLMINEDNDLSAAYRYLEKEKYTLPLYKAKGKVPDQIYTGTLPTTIVLDKEGKIRLRHEGIANYGSKKFLGQIGTLIKE